MKYRVCTVACLLALLLAVSGCKGGDPLSGGISPASAEFIAESPPAGVTERFVSLIVNSSAEGRIFLDLVVSDVDVPISGVALKLTYPDSFSKFVTCVDGDLFEPGQCFFAEPSPGSGEVFVGRTLTGGEDAPTVSGTRVIVRLEFLVFNQGQGPITIEGQNLGGGDASALLDASGNPIQVDWFSGDLVGI